MVQAAAPAHRKGLDPWNGNRGKSVLLRTGILRAGLDPVATGKSGETRMHDFGDVSGSATPCTWAGRFCLCGYNWVRPIGHASR